MLFRKRDEYPSDAVNVFAEPVISFIIYLFMPTMFLSENSMASSLLLQLILFACQMEETTHKHFAFHNEDPGVSNKEYDMWFAGH